ncbi:SIMPL domain-containing protein [Mycobacterium sp. NAZ190054]|uniref:SIMPL domain-containing protein n=1 Tax=Mycobacterium sp. NAZ190054 TaxID=1747766 RepID=UPI0009EB1751|nr:SIMPL domain-containing protein [Mycobacterium sp. NAZ190054]
MTTEITVRGSFSAFHPPERGTVYVVIGYEGPDMEPVYRRVAREFEQAKASATALKQGGAVTWWAAEQLRTWSDRPWNQDGKQLPLVHHATVAMEVKFRDFGALSRWVGEQTANFEGFRLQRVRWALTDKRREQLIVEARTRAVQDATSRAQQYADALGLGKVRPISIADAGMLGANFQAMGDDVVGSVRARGSDETFDAELVPNDIKLSARVDARFIADSQVEHEELSNNTVEESISPSMLALAPPLPEGRWEIHGPGDSALVEAWADDYIRFERRPPWQEQLRDDIRARCRQLEPSAEQLLHATFFGAKHSNADIENVLLYYIDSFRVAGRNGIRFEHGVGVPPAPNGADYPFCYRYALAPRVGGFAHWRQGRTLASFDWTDLGTFVGEKKLAQVWLALARGQVEIIEPADLPKTPFAVKVQVRPPHGHQPVLGNLVKGVIDGVTCAFQAHTDTGVLPDVVARLARDLPADAAEIEAHLLDQRRAVLGVVPRLVAPYQAGVKWDPADHLCVAGEVLTAEPVGLGWAIKGELVELSHPTVAD